MEMDWSLPFCLACDRQTEGDVYCSESCRLAEYEKACSSSGSTPSSPHSPRVSTSWPVTRPSANTFFLPPAYNFQTRQPYSTSPSFQASALSLSRPHSSPAKPVLTPSSSQSSLFSMRSNSSASAERSPVSDEDRRALRDYERAFDQSRYARRQSTH